MRDAEQRGDRGVPAGLLDDAVAGVDEHDRELGGGGAGDHVARVLHVPRGVGEHERAGGGREVPVGDVDRDALLALGAQTVGEQRQVDRVAAAVAADAFDGRKLVRENRLGVVQQPADQRGLAVVDGAGRGQAQQVVPRSAGLEVRVRRRVSAASEVPLALAVLHRGLGHPVVGAGGAALGEPAGGDLGDDLRGACARPTRRRRCSSCRRRCGSGPCGSRPSRRASGRPTRPAPATCRRGGRPRARGSSRCRAARSARARCSARRPARSSWTAGRRARARRACGGRCRGPTARGAAGAGPTGRTRRAARTPAPWRGPSPRRDDRRRTPRRTCSP